jgi:hypothetical protein
MRIVVGRNGPDCALITRDEAGRVRVSGNLSRLSAFANDGIQVSSEEQAELAAHRIVDVVMSQSIAGWNVPIGTDDQSGGK